MSHRIDRVRLAKLLDVEEGFIAELEEHEIVVCDDEGLYDHRAVERVRVCWGMRRSFGVNAPGLEVAVELLERWLAERRRVHELLRELRDLEDDGRG